MRLWTRRQRTPPDLTPTTYAALVLGTLALHAAALWLMGHPTVCECGVVRLVYGGTGTQSSQHFADWYSAGHVIFGMSLYWLMWKTSRHWPLPWRLVVAAASSGIWEVIENTPPVVERFQDTPLGADYRGDSILNSVGDSIFVILGFVVARLLPVAGSVAAVVLLEVGALAGIRDSLLLTLIMFFHPLESIRLWQLQ